MTQTTFDGNLTPGQGLLDQNFTQLYNLRELISTPGYTAATPKVTISSGGGLIVNASSLGYQNLNSQSLEGSGGYGVFSHVSGSASGTLYLAFGYAGVGIGSITQSGTTAVLYNTSSDRRLKKNIAEAAECGYIIDSIKVREFDWIPDGNDHVTHGFIAQELVLVAPQAVKTGDDGESISDTWAVDPSKLVALLVRELQSLRARVAALET